MVNESTVTIYDKSVKCDRYHLLKPQSDIDINNNTSIYTENGNAFNGIGNYIILNKPYDVLKYSRLCKVSLNGFVPFYGLINKVVPIRNNKSAIEIEPDAWLNNRDNISSGDFNTLFETTKFLSNYPFYDTSAKFKWFSNFQPLFNETHCPYIVMVYRQERNEELQLAQMDYVYLGSSNSRIDTFDFYDFMRYIYNNLDSNSIVAIYLSPFPLPGFSSSDIVFGNENSFNIKRQWLPYIQHMVKQHPIHKQLTIVNDPVKKSCILDMNGAIVWQSEFKDVGNRYLTARLDISYDTCQWICNISGAYDGIEESPNNRFSIQCNPIPFFADYYQYYQNLQRSFTAEKRKAQLEKQLVDGVGDTIASSLWHGTSSASPRADSTANIAALGGLVGGLIQTGLNYYSTSDLNTKLDNIENRQAQMQYDTLNSTGSSIGNYYVKNSVPFHAYLNVDFASQYANTTYSSITIKYNCPIRKTDLDLMLNDTDENPEYLKGDFDFIQIPIQDSLQLNSRFKHGVSFVDWV